MDSVYYFKDHGGEMVNLFEYHNRFTLSQIEASVSKNYKDGMYDTYASDAMDHSGEWLVASLAEELKTSLRPHLFGNGCTGPIVWMRLVQEMQSNSLRRLKTVTKDLEKMALKDFKGENVREFCESFLSRCIELDNARRLPDDVMLTIIEALTKSSVDEFRITYLGERKRVEAWMNATAGKSASAIAQMENVITYRTLLAEATSQYQSLLDSGLWGPASGNKDKGTPSAYTAAQVNVLVQKAVDKALGKDKKPITCFNCQKEGHMSRDCPDKAKDGDKKDGKDKKGKRSNGWKRTAPAEGESNTKTVKDKKYYWCDKCKSWNLTHVTDRHEVGKGKKGKTTEANCLAGGLTPNYTIPGLDEDWGSA
jgi:hypothetical protein